MPKLGQKIYFYDTNQGSYDKNKKSYDKNKNSYDKSQLLLFITLSVRNKGEKEINYAKVLNSRIPLRGF